MIEFEKDIGRNFEEATDKEWLVSNGIGGFASSTIIGTNTRRYHGLLIVPENSTSDRKLLLSKVEEEVLFEQKDERFQLSTNQYPGVIHPNGLDYFQNFRLNPFPKLSFELPTLSVEKEIFLPFKRNATIIRYNAYLDSGEEAKIRIRPLINNRDLRKITHRSGVLPDFSQSTSQNKMKIFKNPSKSPFLLMGSDNMFYKPSDWTEKKRWFKDMEYTREKERGYDYREDHYNPGYFELDLSEGENEFNLLAAGGPSASEDFQMIYSKNSKDFNQEYVSTKSRLEELFKEFNSSAPVQDEASLKHLVWASDSFVVNGNSIIAGYHWFGVWGRDSLIALPGLTLVTGRFNLAKEILSDILEDRENGLIPNISKGSRKNFESADASLLFFYALYKYISYTDDYDFAEKIWPGLNEIVESYIEGIEGKVQMGNDSLIWTAPGHTWMDAKINGVYVTPREGKCVELNSLWYNALKIGENIAKNIGKNPDWSGLSNEVEKSFEEKFWNPEKEYLYDVVKEGENDDSFRPNQIFALSLPFPLLDGDKGRKILTQIQNKLLTPYGLRSLEGSDEDYRGVYEGDLRNRDLSYHQGTVWAWLIGPYITALARLPTNTQKEDYMKILRPLITKHLKEAGLGTISEIFDGDGPHTPRGCISQAWSVGELLRCYVEDVVEKRPPYESSLGGGQNY